MTRNLKFPMASAIIGASGATVVMEEENNDNDYQIIKTNGVDIQTNCQEIINLWQFIRMYTISNIPLIDFIVVYVIIYIVNLLYLHYDKKFVLILTFPITILYNILSNNKLKITGFMLIIILISIYYLLTLKH